MFTNTGWLPLLLLQLALLDAGQVDDVDAYHCTAPYCAVKLVVVKGTIDPDIGPSVKLTVGVVVKPLVAHEVESV